MYYSHRREYNILEYKETKKNISNCCLHGRFIGGVKLNAVWAPLLFCPKHLRYRKNQQKQTNALAVETCIREHNTLIWVLTYFLL